MFQIRLLSLVATAVVATACTGQIGDIPGLGRSDDGSAQDVLLSARDGWRSVEASEPAFDKLELKLMARVEVAGIDALITAGSQDIADSSDAAIKVRFAEDGMIDVRDGDSYDSDASFAYEPGVWYGFEISADLQTRTYDVRVGRRSGPLRTLIRDAAFDSEATMTDRLTSWAVWSSQSAKLDVARPSWEASGSCAPTTCLSLAVDCGATSDGCGGALNCGNCASGYACNGGVCEASCVPATCESLRLACGETSDGCGGTLDCGFCPIGQACNVGVCAAVSPPPLCEPVTCVSAGVECGAIDDGCGGALTCGGCASGGVCTNGACVEMEPPPAAACVPRSCVSLEIECGQASDGCSGTLDCGFCPSGQACGSGGSCENVSPPPPPPCEPESCLSLGVQCGPAVDGCGGTLRCGGCASDQACTNGLCEDLPPPAPPLCEPESCLSLGIQCGGAIDGCGGTLNCGFCPSGQACGSGGFCEDVSPPPPPPCEPFSCSEVGAMCGSQSNGCGETIICGTCPGGEICSSGQCVVSGSQRFSTTRTSCMRPCAVQFDAQKAESLTWAQVRHSNFVWDFDDGGGTVDSDGFLAATVYENAGTYTPTATVDGQRWTPQTITVTEPSWTGCVCSSGACTGCPTGNHYRSIGDALRAAGSQPRHILLKRGESHGALPNGDSTPTSIGAYGSGAKPRVTASLSTNINWSYVDLDVDGTGTAFNGGLLLRVDGSGGGTNWIFTTQGIFIVDSSIVVNADYPMQISDHTPWLVVKGSTIDRQRAGQHTIRIDGPNQERILIQDSRILGTGNQDSLTIRGNSRWILVQNTFFDQHAGTYDSQPGDSRLQEKIVWERNAFDRSNNAIDWGFRFQGRDIIVRDNVVYGRGGQFDYMATGGGAGAPKNIWFVNNTSIDNDTNGIRLNNCSTCVAKNNLIYSGNSPWGDCITGTSGANVDANWCSTNDECLDPVDGDRDCYDPNFMSLTYGSADFARPGAGTRGIDAADQTVPVWYDFYGRVSSNLDIGAVEK